ncbi:8-amino-7-oxononanoate synthase [Rubellicoccus peritrichatus]|uniref:8-amino-7-oxononanoate synthase n=1 Tax=Rubellicoccus peritrichatus TaxID=3080537 RepID=A0AAQ3L8W8_9BACT|nr:8-amino-7-oxononanoate synthase [Puniceicoccus sp. CR14]WOO41819.1 8-amino-7-oxononanoate synthase [Puniceicoccus sp. CR14]
MIDRLTERVQAALVQRDRDGLRRRLAARAVDQSLIDLSNNDYLRLSQHPKVIAAGKAALECWGASASASPLITGYTEEHAQLELRLAEWTGFSSGLVWNTGYAANQAVLSVFPKKGDLVLADRLIHNSMISGILRSGARLLRYDHLDVDHLEKLILEHHGNDRTIFVVTESVFSMDGDYPDLKTMAELKKRYGFVWIVDEAHAVGWYGKRGSGLVEETEVSDSVDVLVGTLGKGLGSMGAYTLFHDAALRDYLINFAGEFIYSTYLAPSCTAAARAAINITETLSDERSVWQSRSLKLRQEIAGAASGDSPIVPVVIGDPVETLRIAAELKTRGFLVGAVRPPTVPEGGSRLRISLNSQLSNADECSLIKAMQEVRP